MRTGWPWLVATGVSCLLLVGCGGSGPDSDLLVSAAASLTDVFADVESAFEEAHPGVDVVLNFAGSSTLREQILQGAPVDVFASANLSTMQQVADAGLIVGEPERFARNRLQVVVPVGNPGRVASLEDFERRELLIGLCDSAVPCGDLARRVLDRAGVDAEIDSNEPDVRALLSKVEEGELDAAIVYATDVASSGRVAGIEIPESMNVVAEYLIAVVARPGEREAARRFAEFIRSDPGKEILSRHGFASP